MGLKRLVAVAIAVGSVALATTGSASALSITWMQSYRARGTPAKYDKVGVIKVGPKTAKNVLVLEPGTSAAAAYFVPLAKWIVQRTPGWQVWPIERRENLLEDQSVLNLGKQHRATPQQVFNYYLNYLVDRSIKKHYQVVSDADYAKQWGMNVAVQDIQTVIQAAKRLGGKVVLGGHSLGGSIITAYATWDFHGKPGADNLAGLVYDDGGSNPKPMTFGIGGQPLTAQLARQELQTLQMKTSTPWLAFGGIPAPYAGIFNALGATSVLTDPNDPSLGQTFPLLPPYLKPPVRVTQAGQYGYALDVKTSPPSLIAAQAHLGHLDTRTKPAGWSSAGALTPLNRYGMMFSGWGINNANGTEWYFPQRLTDDSGSVAEGNANPAQQVMDVHATMGHHLPKSLRIYAFGAALGGAGVPAAAKILAKQSGIPMSHLTTANFQKTYAHNDPAGAFPKNAFFDRLVPFLKKISALG